MKPQLVPSSAEPAQPQFGSSRLDASITGRALAGMLLLAVIWGLSIPVTKLGLQSMSPMLLTTLRFLVAVPLLMVYAVGRHPLPRRALPRVAGLGVLGIGIGQAAQAFGVDGTSASVGTVISATIPVFIVYFAAMRLKQRVSALQKLGVAAAFIGIALVAAGRDAAASPSASNGAGAAWLLLSAAAIAFYYVWSVELAEEFGTTPVAAWSTLFGFLAILPLGAHEVWRAPVTVTWTAIASVAYLGVLVTVAGLFLWLRLLRTMPARIAAAVQYLQPLVGVAAAAAMFGDHLGSWFIVRALLVLGGLALTMAPAAGAGRGVME